MADNYLSKTGLGYYHDRVKNIFTNVVEAVKVNGTALVPDNTKAVNVEVPTKTSELTNDSDFQTSTDVASAIDAKVASTYKAKGSCTFAQLPSLVSEHEGEVWNISDSFTTTTDFIEGAGNKHPAGTNVVVINTTGSTYKYDVLTGVVDLSSYWTSTAGQNNALTAITTAEIDAILNPQ